MKLYASDLVFKPELQYSEKKLAFSFGTLLKELAFVCLLVGVLELCTVVMSEGGGDRTHCVPTV